MACYIEGGRCYGGPTWAFENEKLLVEDEYKRDQIPNGYLPYVDEDGEIHSSYAGWNQICNWYPCTEKTCDYIYHNQWASNPWCTRSYGFNYNNNAITFTWLRWIWLSEDENTGQCTGGARQEEGRDIGFYKPPGELTYSVNWADGACSDDNGGYSATAIFTITNGTDRTVFLYGSIFNLTTGDDSFPSSEFIVKSGEHKVFYVGYSGNVPEGDIPHTLKAYYLSDKDVFSLITIDPCYCNERYHRKCIKLENRSTEQILQFDINHGSTKYTDCDGKIQLTKAITSVDVELEVIDHSEPELIIGCENEENGGDIVDAIYPASHKDILDYVVIRNPFTGEVRSLSANQNENTNKSYLTIPLYKDPNDDYTEVEVIPVLKYNPYPPRLIEIHIVLMPPLGFEACNDLMLSMGKSDKEICGGGGGGGDGGGGGSCCSYFDDSIYNIWNQNAKESGGCAAEFIRIWPEYGSDNPYDL